MADWTSILPVSTAAGSHHAVGAWFSTIAKGLLQQTHLMVAGAPHRLVEVEFYLHNREHPDPFAHRQPLQRTCGKWYFHRTGTGLRGGTFKGLDLTFGPKDSFGGVLIRTLETPRGEMINGPSLCVDYLMASVKAESLAALEQSASQHQAINRHNPIWLSPADHENKRIHQTSRVGLSLKRIHESDAARYFVQPYRFLSQPRRVKKGKVHVVLALHLAGAGAEAIQAETGCPRSAIDRYIAQFDAGQSENDVSQFLGTSLSSSDICRIHGTLCGREVNRVE